MRLILRILLLPVMLAGAVFSVGFGWLRFYNRPGSY